MFSVLMLPMMFSLAAVEPGPPLLPANSLYAGAKSLGFAVTTPGNRWRNATVNGSVVLSPQLALTLGLGGNFNRSEVNDTATGGMTTFSSYEITLMPGFRYYLLPQARLTPYVGAAVYGSLLRHPGVSVSKAPTSDGYINGALSFIGRLGAEWFVVPQVSIGGELGFWVDAIRYNPGPAGHVETFSSQLVASFYW